MQSVEAHGVLLMVQGGVTQGGVDNSSYDTINQ